MAEHDVSLIIALCELFCQLFYAVVGLLFILVLGAMSLFLVLDLFKGIRENYDKSRADDKSRARKIVQKIRPYFRTMQL